MSTVRCCAWLLAFLVLAPAAPRAQVAVEAPARVTGIGGVFFLADDPKALAAWYATHLGIDLETWGGAVLDWRKDTAEDGGLTVWGTARSDSEWFRPSAARFMINYRVDDLSRLLDQLRAADIAILQGPAWEPVIALPGTPTQGLRVGVDLVRARQGGR